MLVNFYLKELPKKIWLLVFISIGFVKTYAGKVTTIKGKFETFTFNEFRIVTFDDFITKKYKTIKTVYLENDGSFETQLLFDKITEIDLLVQGSPMRLTILPNSEYNITIAKDRYYYIKSLEEKSDVKINHTLSQIDKTIDNFIETYYVALLSGSYKLPTTTFVDSLTASLIKYPIKNPSCGNCDPNQIVHFHIKSRALSLELLARIKSESTVLKEINQWRLPWFNSEFIQLFENLYKKRFPLIALSKNNEYWIKAVNNVQLDTLEKLMSKNEYYTNKELRQVGLVQGLIECFYEKEFNKKSVLSLLEMISNDKNNIGFKAAENAFKRLSLETSGTLAPDFLVYDINNKEYYLHDMKGRFVYLFFWDYRSDESIRELLAVEELQRNYGKHIAIIPVVSSENLDKLRNFLTRINFKGAAYLSKDGKITKDYNIQSVPYYALINPDGKLVKNPALGPLEGIDLMMYEIKNRLQQRR